MKSFFEKIYANLFTYSIDRGKFINIFFLFILIFSLFGILYILSISQFVRPSIDDYLFLRANQDLSHTLQFNINGRYFVSLIYGLGYSMPGFLKVAPILGILTLFIGIFCMSIIYFEKKYKKSYTLISLLATALLLTFTVIASLPNLYSAIFWFPSAAVHTWSVGLVLIYASYFMSNIHKHNRMVRLTVIAVFGFLVSGMSEIVSGLLFLVLLSVILYAYLKDRKITQNIQEAVVTIIANSLGILLLIFSPGAVNRRTLVDESSTGILDRISAAPLGLHDYGVSYFYGFVHNRWLFLIVFLFGIIMGLNVLRKNSNKYDVKKYFINASMLILLASAVSCIVIIVMVLGSGAMLPTRAYTLGILVIVLTLFVVGVETGKFMCNYKQRHYMSSGIFFVFFVILFMAGPGYISYIRLQKNDAFVWSQNWDERDIIIKEYKDKRVCPIHARSLPMQDIPDIQPDPNNWTNRQLVDYYSIGKSCKVIGY